MLITSSSSAHQRRAFREAGRCEEGHAAGVLGLPPPPRFVYLSRLINPYSVPHLRRVAYDQREVAWLVVTRPSTSSILRWKSPRSPLEESAITERLERFHALLTKDTKGSLTNVAHWGKRSLAYPIKKKDTGFYVVAQFETAAELLPEYERAVKLDEGVLRFLVVVSEGLPAKPEPAPAVIAADVVVDEIEEDEA